MMKERLKPDERVRRLILPEEPRPDVRYVPSRFAVAVAADGTACLFNTLTLQRVEAELPASAIMRIQVEDALSERIQACRLKRESAAVKKLSEE